MKKSFILTTLLLLTITPVLAFGVAAPYFEGYELKVYPGEKVIINLTLQNLVGKQDHTFIAEIDEKQQEFLELVDENPTYLVPLGRSDIKVPLQVHIPRKTDIGELQYAEILFTQTSTNTKGTITLGASFNTKIPIKIVKREESTFYKPKEQTILDIATLTTAWGIVILIILDMTRRIHKKHKQRKRKKQQHKHPKHKQHKQHRQHQKK